MYIVCHCARLPRAFCVGNNSHITLMADIICDSDDCRCEGRSRSLLPSHCSAGQAGGQEGGVLQLSVCPTGGAPHWPYSDYYSTSIKTIRVCVDMLTC